MTWFKVSENPPPQDRVIEVTKGFAWSSSLYYRAYTNKTHRTWYLRGGVYMVIWDKDKYVLAGDGSFAPSFDHWKEFDNPFSEADYISAYPPAGKLYEEFSGDGTYSELMKKAEEADKEATDFYERFGSEVEREKYVTTVVTNYKKKAEEYRKKAETAYDLPKPVIKEI